VIEVPIRSKYRRSKPLSRRKHRIIICAIIAGIIKPHRHMSARLYEVCGRAGKVLIEEKLHSAATDSEYGMSSNCASEPAKAKTADKSSAVTLG